MKYIENNNNFTLFIPNKQIENIDNLKKYIKEITKKLKRKYLKDISGIYDVKVFSNKKIGLILDFYKEEDFDFLKDIIDLNVKVYEDQDIYLEFDDIFILESFNNIYFNKNKFYIDANNLNNKNFLKLIEFSDFIYAEKLQKIKNNLIQLVKTS